MRLLVRAGIAVAACLVVAALAVALVPPMLDWGRYRDRIAAFASDRVGRDVRIDGPVSLTVFPEPVLTASGVTVASGSDRMAVTVAALRLRLAPGALLGGRLAFVDMVLRGLDVRLPWPDAGDAAGPARAIVAALAARVEHARIEQGSLAFGDLVFDRIDATLSGGGITGGLRAAGEMRSLGRQWRFTARMTDIGGDGAAGVDVTLDGLDGVQNTSVSLSGQLAGDGSFAGRATARGPDLSLLLPAPRVRFAAEGRVTLGGGLAAADDLAVTLDTSPARGAVALRLGAAPRLDIALAASRLDLDGWLPALFGGPSLPIPVGLDLSAEAAALGGGTMRRVRAAFDWGASGVTVREMRAVLPGEAQLAASGTIAPMSDGGPAFQGEGSLDAPSLATTLAWATRAGTAPGTSSFDFTSPPGTLQAAAVRGHMTLGRGGLTLAGVRGVLDGSAISGDLAWRNTPRRLGGTGADRPPSLTADVHVGTLLLEPWIAVLAADPLLSGGAVRALDLDLRLIADRAVIDAVSTATPLTVAVRVRDERIVVRTLGVTVGDATATASGTIEPGGRVADARLDLRAETAAAVAPLLPSRFAALLPNTPVLARSPLALRIDASGTAGALALTTVGSLGDLRVDAQARVDLIGGSWEGPITVRHPGAPRFAEALGLAGAPAWLGDGSLALRATLAVDGHAMSLSPFDLTAGALRGGGRLTIGSDHGEWRVDGTIVADTFTLPLPYLRSPEPWRVAGLDGVSGRISWQASRVLAGGLPVLESARGELSAERGVLALVDTTARLAGGAISMSGRLDTAAEPPRLAAKFHVEKAGITGPLFDYPLDLTRGTLDFDGAFSAAGHAPAGLIATLTGAGDVSIRDGAVAGIDLERAARDSSDEAAGGAVAAGVTPFDRLEARLRLSHGRIDVDRLAIITPGGVITATGGVDLPGSSADLALRLRPADEHADGAKAGSYGLRLTGPLSAPRRTPERAGVPRPPNLAQPGQVP